MANQFDDLLAADQAGFDQIYKMALGRELRQDRPATARWGDAVSEIGSDIADKMRLREAEQARQANLAKQAAQVRAAVEAYAPEYKPLIDAGDFKGAAAALKTKIDKEVELGEWNKSPVAGMLAGGGRPQPPAGPERLGSPENYPPQEQGGFQALPSTGAAQSGAPPLNVLLHYETHPNKRVSETAKELRKLFYPGDRQLDRQYPQGLAGDYGLPTGAAEATGDLARAKEIAKADVELIDETRFGPNNEPYVAKVPRTAAQKPWQSVLKQTLGGGQGAAPSEAPAGDLPSPMEVLGNLAAAEKDPAKQQALLARMEALSGGQPFEMKVAPGRGAVLSQSLTPQGAPGGVLTPQGAEILKDKEAKDRAYANTMGQVKALRDLNSKMSKGWADTAVTQGMDIIGPIFDKNAEGSEQAAADNSFGANVSRLALELVTTMKGNLSDKDVKFLQEMNASKWDTPATRKKLIDDLERITKEGYLNSSRATRPGADARPTSPGAPAAGVPGPRSSAEDARGLPESYWTATAGGAGPSDAMPEGRPADPTKEGPPSRWSILKDVGRNVASLPDVALTSEGREGFQDAWGNLLIGLGQRLGITPQGEAWKDESKRQEDRAKESRAYQQGNIFGGIFRPDALLGGGATALPKVAGYSAGQGFVQPSADAKETVFNTGASALLGTGGAAASRLLPTNVLSPEAAAARKGFEDVPLSTVNTRGNTIEARIGRSLGMGEDIAQKQVGPLTQKLLSNAKAEVLSPEGMNAARNEMGSTYESLFNRYRMAPLVPDDARRLATIMQDFPITQDMINKGAARNLQSLQHSIENINPNIVDMVDMRLLHDSWKEIRRIATQHGADKAVAANLRDMIGNIMERGIGPEGMQTFRETNRAWKNLEDLTDIYSSGASINKGVDTFQTLRPSRIEEAGMRNPMLGQDTADAIRFIQAFNVKDATPQVTQPSIAGMIQSVAGPGLNAIDLGRFGDAQWLNTPEGMRKIVEMLRQATSQTPREIGEYGRK